MNYHYYIGIDVSKKTLDYVVFKKNDLLIQHLSTNDLSGIEDFISKLRSVDPEFKFSDAIFCMEHTGIYNQHLLNFLYANKAHICLENPVQITLSSGLQRGKNDKIDAVRIAQYAYKNRETLRLWKPKKEVMMQLKQLTGLRNRLLKAKMQLSAVNKDLKIFEKQRAMEIIALSKSSIKAISEDIKKVDAKIKEVIQQDPELKRLFDIVTSVEGIGKITATEIIVTTNEFKDINDPKKFACYSGVAPFSYSSGSSIKGKARVSHKANKSMKRLLHMAALTSIKNSIEMKQYYQRKLSENKNKMSIINAVRNKLIQRIFACVKENRLYEKKSQNILV